MDDIENTSLEDVTKNNFENQNKKIEGQNRIEDPNYDDTVELPETVKDYVNELIYSENDWKDLTKSEQNDVTERLIDRIQELKDQKIDVKKLNIPEYQQEAIENYIPRIPTINERYAGRNHPETSVPYVEKVVTNEKGEKVRGVFPVFDSDFDATLPEDMYLKSDKDQFNECIKQLNEKCANDPEFRKKFTKEQMDDIMEGRTPEGYTWHHNEELGKMQLVKSDIHGITRHTGGRSIWGGGTENRK